MLLAALTLSTPVIIAIVIVLAIFLWPAISGSGPNVSHITEPRVTASFQPAVALDPQVAAHRDLTAVAKHLEGRELGVEAGPHLDALAALISRRT